MALMARRWQMIESQRSAGPRTATRAPPHAGQRRRGRRTWHSPVHKNTGDASRRLLCVRHISGADVWRRKAYLFAARFATLRLTALFAMALFATLRLTALFAMALFATLRLTALFAMALFATLRLTALFAMALFATLRLTALFAMALFAPSLTAFFATALTLPALFPPCA